MKLSDKFGLFRPHSWLTKTIIVFIIIGFILGIGIWFQRTHVGWLIESVPAPGQFLQHWQAELDNNQTLIHPAIIHHLPSACLCTLLTIGHAKSLSNRAINSGFKVYQTNSQHKGLGTRLQLLPPQVSPTIAITNANGQIVYLGAYSDGVRCTEANSMVDAFIDKEAILPKHAVVGLDVKVCRCEPSK